MKILFALVSFVSFLLAAGYSATSAINEALTSGEPIRSMALLQDSSALDKSKLSEEANFMISIHALAKEKGIDIPSYLTFDRIKTVLEYPGSGMVNTDCNMDEERSVLKMQFNKCIFVHQYLFREQFDWRKIYCIKLLAKLGFFVPILIVSYWKTYPYFKGFKELEDVNEKNYLECLYYKGLITHKAYSEIKSFLVDLHEAEITPLKQLEWVLDSSKFSGIECMETRHR